MLRHRRRRRARSAVVVVAHGHGFAFGLRTPELFVPNSLSPALPAPSQRGCVGLVYDIRGGGNQTETVWRVSRSGDAPSRPSRDPRGECRPWS